jgi:threonine dehydrogenase-like Zn-dependent dehydrogenase
MRALIRRAGKLVVDEMPAPEPAPGQLLCKSLVCGVCGSDLHALDHYDHMIDLSERLGGVSQMTKGADTVFGHEYCCEVLEAAGRFKAGDKVVSPPGLMTANGAETIGYSSRVPGGFAQQMLLTEALTLPVPNGLSAEHAALTEPLAVGEHAVAMAEPSQDQAFLVVGCGPVGLAVIASLKARGLGPVIAADFSAERRRAAERMGADTLVDAAAVSPHASWSDVGVPVSRGEMLMAQMSGKAVKRPVIFECVGAPGMLQSLAEAAPPGARVIVAGVCMESDRIEPLAFVVKEVELRFVFGYSRQEFAKSLENLAEGRTRYPEIITGVVGLEAGADAFVKLQTDKSQIKILVAPDL